MTAGMSVEAVCCTLHAYKHAPKPHSNKRKDDKTKEFRRLLTLTIVSTINKMFWKIIQCTKLASLIFRRQLYEFTNFSITIPLWLPCMAFPVLGLVFPLRYFWNIFVVFHFKQLLMLNIIFFISWTYFLFISPLFIFNYFFKWTITFSKLGKKNTIGKWTHFLSHSRPLLVSRLTNHIGFIITPGSAPPPPAPRYG